MDQKLIEFFERLKGELESSTTWPSEYLFKFIVPTAKDKVENIESLFDGLGAVLQTKRSKNEKYTSVSVSVMMDNAEAVIQKYKEASTIEGIISL